MMEKEPVDMTILRRFSPLDGLRQQNLLALSKKAVLQAIPAGRPLFREGATDKKNYYLVRGDVELRTGAAVVSRLRADTPEARNPITPGNPRRFGAYAVTTVETLVFDSDLLDVLLTWDQTGVYDVKAPISGAILYLAPAAAKPVVTPTRKPHSVDGTVDHAICQILRRTWPDARCRKRFQISDGVLMKNGSSQ